jgi:hypothetical protein
MMDGDTLKVDPDAEEVSADDVLGGEEGEDTPEPAPETLKI